MKKLITTAAIAMVMASGPVFAQATAPKAPTTTTPSTSTNAAADAKFKAADKDNNGTLSGTELDAYKADMTKIDANKDGSVSREEFASAVKSGVIK